jgi:phage terminase small subunit
MTQKQQRFVQEYCVDVNATQAAIRAGYSARSAGSIGAENLTKPEIASAISAVLARTAAKLELSKEWVLRELISTVAAAKEAGQFAASNKALELLGRQLGCFSDRLDLDFTDLSSISDAELERRRRELGIR